MNLLEGVKVLDLSRILAGPFATQSLAQMGADVIKVESPEGDPSRRIGPFAGERSLYFSSLNTGKRSVVIDLRADRPSLDPLLDWADIVVDNFRPGSLEQLGLNIDSIRETRPELVWISVTGYRSDSARAQEPAYDLSAQAEGGIMAVTGDADGPPVRAGVAISDLATGLWAATAALGAYPRRLLSGEGAHLEIPLVDSTMTLLSYVATSAAFTGKEPGRVGSGHHTLVPYGAYPTRDGWIALAIIGDKFWHRLVATFNLEVGDWGTNEQRRGERGRVDEVVAEAFAAYTTNELSEILAGADIPHSPIRGVLELMADEYGAGATQDFQTESAPYRLVNAPTGPVPGLRPAPRLGEHTKEVLG